MAQVSDISPLAGSVLEKRAEITFSVSGLGEVTFLLDFQGDEPVYAFEGTLVYVRGEVVFDAGLLTFSDGWIDSSYEELEAGNSFKLILRPSRAFYYRNGETVDVAVEVSGETLSSWSYVADASPIRLSTYRMILRSIRDRDSD